jgi:hypothetical protein
MKKQALEITNYLIRYHKKIIFSRSSTLKQRLMSIKAVIIYSSYLS